MAGSRVSAGAALLGALPGGGADDPEPAPGQRDVERHARREPRRRLVGAQPAGVVAVAGHRAVEREADGVEHARLARRRWRRRAGRARPSDSASKSTSAVSTNGPKAVTESRWSRISRPPDEQHVGVGVVGSSASQACSSSADSAAVAGAPRSVGHEVERDLVVAAAARGRGRDDGARAAGRGEGEDEGVGEAGPQPLHRMGRPDGVGEGRLDPAVLERGERGIGEQRLEVAADPGQPPGHGRLDERRPLDAVAPEVDQPAALGVAGLGEGVGQRRPAVAHASRRAPPGRAGGRARCRRCRRRARRGTTETPPTLMSRSDSLGSATGHERVGQHDRARPAGAARSARTRRIASARAASWLRAGSRHGSCSACGSR